MRSRSILCALKRHDVDALAAALQPHAFGGSDPDTALFSALLDLTLNQIRRYMDWADGWLDDWAQKCNPDDDYYRAMRALYERAREILIAADAMPRHLA